jgi:propanol-preferring alcohol dehydrogenase
MTVGHEIAGWIAKVGDGVDELEKGMQCLITLYGCGNCWYCVNGWNNYCLNKPPQPGMGIDGGLAEYVIVKKEGIIQVFDLDLVKAAPLTDAGLSSYHAIKRVEKLLYPDANVVVIGIGGLGHLAVMVLKSLYWVNLIAVDISEKALELAENLGSDYTVKFDSNCVNEIKKIVKNKGIQVVFDFVGNGDTILLGSKLICPLGHIVVVGRGNGDFQFNHRAIPYGAFISTTFGGTKAELFELIELLKKGVVEPVIEKFSFNDVEYAFEKLKKGEITGRGVIVISDWNNR